MKVKLNYVPWKITVLPAYRATQTEEISIPNINADASLSIPQRIHDGIQRWRRFPVAYSARTEDEIFVLLDRIPTPFSLLDPMATQVAMAEKCKPSELPAELRGLYERLVALGHAQPE